MDTLKDLSIVSQDFPMPMDPHLREPKSPKARRVRYQEEEDEWLTEKEIEDEEERRWKTESCAHYKKEWAASGHFLR